MRRAVASAKAVATKRPKGTERQVARAGPSMSGLQTCWSAVRGLKARAAWHAVRTRSTAPGQKWPRRPRRLRPSPAGRPGRALELFGGALAVLGKHQAAGSKAPGHDHAHHLRAGAWLGLGHGRTCHPQLPQVGRAVHAQHLHGGAGARALTLCPTTGCAKPQGCLSPLPGMRAAEQHACTRGCTSTLLPLEIGLLPHPAPMPPALCMPCRRQRHARGRMRHGRAGSARPR
jgi:hypothetical protein